MSIVTDMAALADQLDDRPTVKAYHDPAKALGNRPCLLVAPPVLDRSEGTFTGPGVEWRILALSSREPGTLDAVKELAPLIEHVDDVVGIERAEPGRYQLTASDKPVAAYICTHFSPA